MLRPISGSASLAVATDIMKTNGVANSQPYYKILGIKYYDGVFQQTMSYAELVQRWEYFSIYKFTC